MIEYARGDLLDADVEAFVNPVNTVGHMGKGLAAQFKRRYKQNAAAYRAACDAGDVVLGRMFVWEEATLEGRRVIINFPTKGHWRRPSQLPDIVAGLEDLRRQLIERNIASVAVPALGCGLGGLPWTEVKLAIEGALAEMPSTRVVIFEPDSADR